MSEDLGDATLRLSANRSHLDSVLMGVEKSVLGKFKFLSTKTGALMTAGFLVAGAAAVGFGAKAIGAAVDYESAFADVRKTVDATEEEYATLSKGIRDMAKEIPTAATELAELAGVAGQLGIEKDAVLDFTRVVADLGETTNMSGEQAATTMARLANIMQTPQESYSNLGSTIVALGNNLATTESEIADMALRLAKTGVQVGLTEAEVLAFSGALSSVGIEAQAGGSAFSKAFIDMAQAVDKGGEKLDLFAETAGMSSDEFAKAFGDNAALAMVSFTEGLGRIRDEGGSVFQVLEDLGVTEVRMRDALLGAAGAGDLFRESLELGSQAWEENTALTDEAAQRYETTAAKWEIFKNRLNDFMITIGSVLLPVANDFLDWISNFALSLGGEGGPALGEFGAALSAVGALIATLRPLAETVFDAIGKALRGVALQIGGAFKTVRGVIQFIVALLTGDFESMKAALGTIWGGIVDLLVGQFKLVTAPIRAVLEAVGVDVEAVAKTVVGAFENTIVPAANAVADAFEAIGKVAVPAVEFAMDAAGKAFGAASKWVDEHVGPVIDDIGDLLANAGEWWKPRIETALEDTGDIWANATEWWAPRIETATTDVGDIITSAVDWWGETFRAFSRGKNFHGILGAIGAVALTIGRIFERMFQAVGRILEGGFAMVQGIFGAAAAVFTGDWSRLGEEIGRIWSGLWGFMTGVVQFGTATINTLVEVMWENFGGAIEDVLDAAGRFAGGVAVAFAQAAAAVGRGVAAAVAWVAGLPGRMLGALASLAGLIAGKAREAWNRFKAATTSGALAVVAYVLGIPGRIVDALGDLGRLLYAAGRALMQGFVDGIKSMAKTVLDVAVDVALAPIRPIERALKIKSPSKVFYDIGKLSVDGLVLGLTAGLPRAAFAGESLAAATIPEVCGRRGSGGDFNLGGIRVYLGTREITDIIRTEIDTADGNNRRQIRAGLRPGEVG